MELKLTKPIAFIDLETTGINIVTDRIVEICILKVMVDNSTVIKTQRINPTIPIPYFATMIHGIKDEDVKDCPTFSTAAKGIVNFISDSDLAGYNSIKFDIPMLVEEFYRAGVNIDVKNCRIIDVQNIFHKMEQRNLIAAYKFYCGKDLIDAHSAEADTIATYEVLKAQLERYEETIYKDRKGNVSKPITNDVKALSEFSYHTNNADLAGHIIYNEKDIEVFNFGKHKGKPVAEVFVKEPAYYDWMMKGEFPLSTKNIITSIKLRGFNKGEAKVK
jgi:DNA polymerase III subunit epsilon